MIIYKTIEQIELIRQSSLLVAKTHAEIAKLIRPGITTKQLDKIAEEFIRDNNAIPAFKGYGGFPATLCTSVNEEVVHGIPGERVLKNGDIISVDCGVKMNDYYGDSAYTYAVGDISKEKENLLKITEECLKKGLEFMNGFCRLGDISCAIQKHAEENKFSVVRELVGHGIGRNLHEDPQVPNFGKRGRGVKLKEGMVIAVEPMINLGKKEVIQLNDGWTIKTVDGLPSAHFEHTVAIVNNKLDVLSSFKYLKKELKKNG